MKLDHSIQYMCPKEDLPSSFLSVVLIGTAFDKPKITSDKITLDFNAREYIDN